MVSVHLLSLVLFLFVFIEMYLADALCYLSLCCLAGKSDLEADSAALATFPTALPAAWQFEWDGAGPWKGQGLGLLPQALKLTPSMAAFVPQDWIRVASTGSVENQPDSTTVCLGVWPSYGLNSFPCFLELTIFSSTIVSWHPCEKVSPGPLAVIPEC